MTHEPCVIRRIYVPYIVTYSSSFGNGMTSSGPVFEYFTIPFILSSSPVDRPILNPSQVKKFLV